VKRQLYRKISDNKLLLNCIHHHIIATQNKI